MKEKIKEKKSLFQETIMYRKQRKIKWKVLGHDDCLSKVVDNISNNNHEGKIQIGGKTKKTQKTLIKKKKKKKIK